MTVVAVMMRVMRRSDGATVREFARRLGISAATVSRIERGHPMSLDTWLKVQTWLLKKTR